MNSDAQLPAPLVTAADTIEGLKSFMLNVDRLFASELWAIATGDEFKAAVALWGRAWQQVPAGSLPDDERLLAAFSGAGRRWPKLRAMALRGFVKCSDGRLYHRVLCEDVLRAAQAKKMKLERTRAASEARRAKDAGPETPPPGGEKANDFSKTGDRNDDRNVQRNDDRNDDRNDLRHVQRNDDRNDDVTKSSRPTLRSPIDETGRDVRKKERKSEAPAREAHPASDLGSPSPPRLASNWNSRENMLRIEKRLRETEAGQTCLDPRVSPIAKLESEGFDLETEILPVLHDVQAGSKKPIRSWMLYASRARSRLIADRSLNRAEAATQAGPKPVVFDGPTVELGVNGTFSEAIVAAYVDEWRKDPSCWFPFLGPKPGEPGCLIPNRFLDAEAA